MEISYVTQIAEESCSGSMIQAGLSYPRISMFSFFFTDAYDASQYLVGDYERT
jgi:hypothetical protein